RTWIGAFRRRDGGCRDAVRGGGGQPLDQAVAAHGQPGVCRRGVAGTVARSRGGDAGIAALAGLVASAHGAAQPAGSAGRGGAWAGLRRSAAAAVLRRDDSRALIVRCSCRGMCQRACAGGRTELTWVSAADAGGAIESD